MYVCMWINNDRVFVICLCRELVTGVEALKNVSEILQYIDNVTELNGPDTRHKT